MLVTLCQTCPFLHDNPGESFECGLGFPVEFENLKGEWQYMSRHCELVGIMTNTKFIYPKVENDYNGTV